MLGPKYLEAPNSATWGWGAWPVLRNAPPHVVYRTKYGRSRSKGVVKLALLLKLGALLRTIGLGSVDGPVETCLL